MVGFEVEAVEGRIGRGEDARLELEGLGSLVRRDGGGDSPGEDGRKAEKDLHPANRSGLERKRTLCMWTWEWCLWR